MPSGCRLPLLRGRWYIFLVVVLFAWPLLADTAEDHPADCAAIPPKPIFLDAKGSRFYPGFHGFLASITPGQDGFEALRSGTAPLKPNCHRQLRTHPSSRAIWFRFDVASAPDRVANWVLAAEEIQVAAITVHELLPDGKHRIKRNGTEVPNAERYMQLRRAVVGLAPAYEGVTHYLVHIDPGAAPVVTLSLQPFASYQAEEASYLIMACVFIGFLAAIALYNLNLYFNMGVDAAPFYVLYAAFLIINTAAYGGLLFWMTSWSWPRLDFDRAV